MSNKNNDFLISNSRNSVTSPVHQISIVIPVYAGQNTLPKLIEEIVPFLEPRISGQGNHFSVTNVVLVHDCGPDLSYKAIEELASRYSFIQPVWLTKNFGQHSATIAGISFTTTPWVATIDEDGQQNPRDIPLLLDTALENSYQIVYAKPINNPPHGLIRNFFSKLAKKISAQILGNYQLGTFNSFRLINGDVARSLAIHCKYGVYMDVALSWVSSSIGYAPLMLREEFDRPSSYSFIKLLSHFWRLVLTTGTRPLRLITFTGIISIFLAVGMSVYAFYGKYVGNNPVQGWTSLLIVVSFFSGAILASLGIISEYLAATMGIVVGRPLYILSKSPVPDCKKK